MDLLLQHPMATAFKRKERMVMKGNAQGSFAIESPV
jgi:hypothetical protein